MDEIKDALASNVTKLVERDGKISDLSARAERLEAEVTLLRAGPGITRSGEVGKVESLGSGGQEYNRRLHGPLKFPFISLSASDRAMAEAHIRSSTGRKYEDLSDDRDSETKSQDGESLPVRDL